MDQGKPTLQGRGYDLLRLRQQRAKPRCDDFSEMNLNI